MLCLGYDYCLLAAVLIQLHAVPADNTSNISQCHENMPPVAAGLLK